MAKSQKTFKCAVAGVGLGKAKIALSISFSRGDFNLDAADELLNGATLDCEIIPGKDVDGQQPLFDEKYARKFSCECRGLRVTPEEIGARLSISKKGGGVTVSQLESFAFKTCRVKVSRTGDVKTESDHADDDNAGEAGDGEGESTSGE